MPIVSGAFQTDAFQNDAFQVEQQSSSQFSPINGLFAMGYGYTTYSGAADVRRRRHPQFLRGLKKKKPTSEDLARLMALGLAVGKARRG